jgi:predicted DNA-binding transcriptional regulator AlpA
MKDDIVPVKTSFSVPELRSMLGLSKVESYWLVHQQRFTTVIAGGRMRVMRDSFENWYARQFHYRKVNGPAPGAYWEETTMSVSETSALLGIQESTLYDLLKKEPFQTMRIDNKLRIEKSSFEQWYAGQFHYKKVAGTPPGEKWTGNTMSVQEAADLLGVSTGLIYTLSRNGAFQRLYIDRKIRIDTQSFESWYQNQSRYKKMPSQTEVI